MLADDFLLHDLALIDTTGIEPSFDSDATDSSVCDCENFQQCRAANALHFDCFKGQFLSSLDAELRGVIEAWNATAPSLRKTILTLIESGS